MLENRLVQCATVRALVALDEGHGASNRLGLLVKSFKTQNEGAEGHAEKLDSGLAAEEVDAQ